MDELLRKAVDLFNAQRFTEFQDALEGIAARTRAASELHFYTLLGHLAEGLHQIGNAKFESAEALLQPAVRKLEDYLPRFRGLHVESLREDFLQVMGALREARASGRSELRLERWPRLRALPD
jgi:hypothetical protein